MDDPVTKSSHHLEASYEPTISAFERVWEAASPPLIHEFVADCSPDFKDQLLYELVVIDMEFRWQASAQGQVLDDGLGSQPNWSDYVRHVPGIGTVCNISPELIAEEYRVRQLWGDRPGHDRFMSAFPNQFAELPKWLAKIDDELHVDGGSVSQARPTSLAVLAEPDPRAPLPWSDYVLQEHLGSGGFGKVYRAFQKSLDRPVAVKALHKARQQDQQAVEQFIQEARLLARLNHPGIVSVDGLGQFPGGGYFLVLEWIDGEDLQQRLNHGTMPTDEAVRIAVAVADAIHHAHQCGVIHGDLKPSNVLLGRDGRVYITDFGLAHLMPQDDELPVPTQFQGGTIAFLAPEVTRGDQVGVAVDIYGLGALTYAVLTGRPPRQPGSAEAILEEIESGRAVVRPSLIRSDIPRQLDDCTMKCLDAKPERRFATAADVAVALARYVRDVNEEPPT